MRYKSKSYQLIRLLFGVLFIGSSWLLTQSQLPLLARLQAVDILWLFIGFTIIGYSNSLARIKFHSFLVHGLSLSLPLFFFSWYFRPQQIMDRLNQITDSHHWILWRQNLSFDRYAVSWFFAVEGLIVLAYSLFIWRVKTKDCPHHSPP